MKIVAHDLIPNIQYQAKENLKTADLKVKKVFKETQLTRYTRKLKTLLINNLILKFLTLPGRKSIRKNSKKSKEKNKRKKLKKFKLKNNKKKQ